MTEADVWGEDAPVGRRALLTDVVGGVLVALVGVAAGAAQGPWSVGVGLGVGLAVALRRLTLRWAVVTGLAAGLAQVLVDQPNPTVVALGLLTFALGAHRSVRVRWTGAALAGLGVAVAAVWAGRLATADGASGLRAGVGTAAMAAVVLVGGLAAGFIRWQRRESLRARVAERLLAVEERRLRDLVAQEQERARIAADMHDVIAHSWAVVAAQADGARYVLDAEPERTAAALEVIGDTARSAMTDVRLLLDRLRGSGARPEDARDEPDADALLARLRASGMRLEHRSTGAPVAASLEPATRVLAECLTNALKHGDLSEPVHVEEEWGAGYRLVVRNAVPARSRPGTGGLGLTGMRERLAEAGGTLTAGPDDHGRGWQVTATIPPRPLAPTEGS